MVVEILGVPKLAPVPKLVPPELAAYHVYVPAQPVADKATVPAPQRLPPTPVGAVGGVLIVATAEPRVALTQPLTVQST